MNLKRQIDKIPIGASTIWINKKKYLVTKKEFNQGKSCKVFAQELGGKDFISFNYYETASGTHLKPCEMPTEKVKEFLENY